MKKLNKKGEKEYQKELDLKGRKCKWNREREWRMERTIS